MWKWILTIFISIFLMGALWLGYLHYQVAAKDNETAEKIAWQNCIKENDQGSAGNLVCRSLYPKAYQLFYKEFYQK